MNFYEVVLIVMCIHTWKYIQKQLVLGSVISSPQSPSANCYIVQETCFRLVDVGVYVSRI